MITSFNPDLLEVIPSSHLDADFEFEPQRSLRKYPLGFELLYSYHELCHVATYGTRIEEREPEPASNTLSVLLQFDLF